MKNQIAKILLVGAVLFSNVASAQTEKAEMQITYDGTVASMPVAGCNWGDVTWPPRHMMYCDVPVGNLKFRPTLDIFTKASAFSEFKVG